MIQPASDIDGGTFETVWQSTDGQIISVVPDQGPGNRDQGQGRLGAERNSFYRDQRSSVKKMP